MISLSLTVFEDSTKASMIADWSGLAQNVTAENDENGFSFLSAFIPMTLTEAFMFYDSTPFAHVVLSDGAFTAFEGRIEDRRIVNGGLEIGVFGYQNALRDVPYVGMWSTTKYDDWIITTDEQIASRNAEKYVMRKDDDHLYIGLRAGETYANSDEAGQWSYRLPSKQGNDSDFGGEDLAHIAFNYDIKLPTDWIVRTSAWDRQFTSGATEDTITADGTNQTGSKSISISASSRIIGILARNETGGTSTNANETGDYWVKITGVRIKTTSTANVYADEIVEDLIAFVNGINSTQLSSSTALVESPATDLPDAEWLDEYPARILDDLISRGDDSTPPELYEWGVWEDQKLHFRTKGSQGKTWYTDAASIQLDSTIDEMYNSLYVKYRERWAGRITRTAVDDDAASQSKYGVVRRKAIAWDTTDSTLAETVRDTALEQSKDITPRSTITMNGLYDSSGAFFPLYMARAGDVLVIRNFPAGAGGVVDNIRAMYLSRVQYNADTDTLTPTPGLELPSLEFMVAANAARQE